MPVIDETVITKEIKAFKAEVKKELESIEKRIAELEGKKGK